MLPNHFRTMLRLLFHTELLISLSESIPQFRNHRRNGFKRFGITMDASGHNLFLKETVQARKVIGDRIFPVEGRAKILDNILSFLQTFIRACHIFFLNKMDTIMKLFNGFIVKFQQHITSGHGHDGLFLITAICVCLHILAPFCRCARLNFLNKSKCPLSAQNII